MSDRDNITLPREVVEGAVEALEYMTVTAERYVDNQIPDSAIAALRTHLAAPKQEPVAVFDEQMGHPVLLLGSPMLKDKQPLYAAPPALVAPPEDKTHPGYVIGSHWLETAYSRICAGEAEADVLRDMGWERVDEALRRDAERWKWVKGVIGAEDAAIDAAMENKR